MGDRYELNLHCANCKTDNEVYYAPSSGFMSFTCVKCKKINWVSMDFVAKIVSPEEEKELYKLNGFY